MLIEKPFQISHFLVNRNDNEVTFFRNDINLKITDAFQTQIKLPFGYYIVVSDIRDISDTIQYTHFTELITGTTFVDNLTQIFYCDKETNFILLENYSGVEMIHCIIFRFL